MPDMLTVSTKGQITLPVVEYKGFIKDTYDPEEDLALAMEAAASHIVGEDEC